MHINIHSLRVKVTAIAIVATLASLAAFGLASFYTVGQETSVNAAEKMYLLSQNEQLKLDTYLNSVEQSVEMMAHVATNSLDAMTLVQNGANKEPDKRTAEQQSSLDAYLKGCCAHVQNTFDSMASHTDHVVMYYFCVVPEISTQEHGFLYSRMGKAGFEQLAAIDVRELDPNAAKDVWYFSALEHGAPSWVGPYQAKSLDNAYTESYLTPIYKSGILIGVLGMDVLFSTMVDQIQSLTVYDTGYAYLVDEEGRVLYHPTLAMGEVVESARQAYQADGNLGGGSGKRIIRYDQNGEEWQLAFSTLANGMKLVVTAPVAEVTASWRGLARAIPIVAVGILALLVPITLFIVKEIIQPLQQLTEASHRLASGDYNIELDYHGNDEVGELTDSFRRLRNHLQVYIINLDDETYVDPVTCVKNKNAFDIYVTRLNDAIDNASDPKAVKPFALVAFHCVDARNIEATLGVEARNEHLQTACELICQSFSRCPVFRLDTETFCVLLQDREYEIRDELLLDFGIRRDMSNRRAKEEWQKITATKGMAAFRPGEDQDVETVLTRASKYIAPEG